MSFTFLEISFSSPKLAKKTNSKQEVNQSLVYFGVFSQCPDNITSFLWQHMLPVKGYIDISILLWIFLPNIIPRASMTKQLSFQWCLCFCSVLMCVLWSQLRAFWSAGGVCLHCAGSAGRSLHPEGKVRFVCVCRTWSCQYFTAGGMWTAPVTRLTHVHIHLTHRSWKSYYVITIVLLICTHKYI